MLVVTTIETMLPQKYDRDVKLRTKYENQSWKPIFPFFRDSIVNYNHEKENQ